MKENFWTAKRMWASASGNWKGKKKKQNCTGQIRLFKQFVAVYLISPLTSNKMLTPTPCFQGWLCRAVAPWGTMCCAGPWLWGSQLPTKAPKTLDIWFTLASHPGNVMEESASFTGCCRCGSPRTAPGDTGKAGGTLAWPDSSSCCSPPQHLPSFSIQCSPSPFSEVAVTFWERLLHSQKW